MRCVFFYMKMILTGLARLEEHIYAFVSVTGGRLICSHTRYSFEKGLSTFESVTECIEQINFEIAYTLYSAL